MDYIINTPNNNMQIAQIFKNNNIQIKNCTNTFSLLICLYFTKKKEQSVFMDLNFHCGIQFSLAISYELSMLLLRF